MKIFSALLTLLCRLVMLNKNVYCIALLLLLSCHKYFNQSQSVIKKQTASIRNYIKAEDSRDTLLLRALLADTITVYWKMDNPTRQKIIAFYKEYWTKNKYSKNVVQSISPLAKNTYAVKTFFEVQRIQADTVLHIESTIVYKLNTANKIVYVSKE